MADTRQRAEVMQRTEAAMQALLTPLREAVDALARDTSYDAMEALTGRTLVTAGYAHHRLAEVLTALETALGDAADMERAYRTLPHSALYRRQATGEEVAP